MSNCIKMKIPNALCLTPNRNVNIFFVSSVFNEDVILSTNSRLPYRRSAILNNDCNYSESP